MSGLRRVSMADEIASTSSGLTSMAELSDKNSVNVPGLKLRRGDGMRSLLAPLGPNLPALRETQTHWLIDRVWVNPHQRPPPGSTKLSAKS